VLEVLHRLEPVAMALLKIAGVADWAKQQAEACDRLKPELHMGL
jgi:hypothetical protein